MHIEATWDTLRNCQKPNQSASCVKHISMASHVFNELAFGGSLDSIIEHRVLPCQPHLAAYLYWCHLSASCSLFIFFMLCFLMAILDTISCPIRLCHIIYTIINITLQSINLCHVNTENQLFSACDKWLNMVHSFI